MRRLLEVTVLLATGLVLVATSATYGPCADEAVTLRVEGSCGLPGQVVVTSKRDCRVWMAGAADAGLPEQGSLQAIDVVDAGVMSGFVLSGMPADGGSEVTCTADRVDGGLSLVCAPFCAAGTGSCGTVCAGSLTP